MNLIYIKNGYIFFHFKSNFYTHIKNEKIMQLKIEFEMNCLLLFEMRFKW